MESSTCYAAAKNGQIQCLRYAHENGAPWDDRTCFETAFNDQLPCLIYAFLNGAPWHDAPPEMVAWRERVINTTCLLVGIQHAVILKAVNVIKRVWIERFYRPGGRGWEIAWDHFVGLGHATS